MASLSKNMFYVHRFLVVEKFKSSSTDALFETVINVRPVYFLKYILPNMGPIIQIKQKCIHLFRNEFCL